VGVDVGVETSDDAGGLGFDLDLGDGLDLTGGDDRTGNVAALSLGKLGGLEFGAVAARGYRDAEDDGEDEEAEASPDPKVPFAFACRQGVAPEIS